MHYDWTKYGIYRCPGCEVLTVVNKTRPNKDGTHCSHCQLERKEVDPKTRKWVHDSYNHFKPKNMGAFGAALTKEHIINGQKYQMWGFDTKSKASANQQADQLRRHGKDVIVMESKNPDLIKGWIIFAKNRRGRKIGGFGETPTSNAGHITNINEFWSRHNGKTVTLNGIAYKIKYSEHNAIHPYKHVAVSIYLDPVNKRSEYYLKTKRELGDDWSMDAKDISDIALIKILKQLER